MMSLSKLFFQFKFFIFAKRCCLCGELGESHNLCFECFQELKFLSISCKKCQQPLSYIGNEIDICFECIDKNYEFFDEMICGLVYNSFLKKYIVMLKNQNAFYLADIFCKILFNKIKNKITKNTIIAPIPLYSTRLFNRGYNQSLILANAFAKMAEIKCHNDLIKRTRNTTTQANKTFKQREKNVKNAFEFNEKYKEYIKDKEILIIDDIITTGATIFEAAKSLKREKYKSLKLLSIGRRIKGINE